MTTSAPIELHVIADSTGETAARVARAAAAQYPDDTVRIVRHQRVTRSESIENIFHRIAESSARRGVFFTVVDEDLRREVHERCDQLGVPRADLLDQALAVMEDVTGHEPSREIRPVGLAADYFKRVAAMEFAVNNDDGQLTTSLQNADLVLVGVSRSGKTPLSMYLGYLGYKTANIPLVPGIEPPAALFECDPWKVVGLTVKAERLVDIRRRRVASLGTRLAKDGYTDIVRVYDELDEVTAIMRRLRCPIVDTTTLALEEAAARIIEIAEDRAAKLRPREGAGRESKES